MKYFVSQRKEAKGLFVFALVLSMHMNVSSVNFGDHETPCSIAIEKTAVMYQWMNVRKNITAKESNDQLLAT